MFGGSDEVTFSRCASDGELQLSPRTVEEVDLFATEDREQAYRYAVRIWRAAGFEEPTGLFGPTDDRVLAPLGG